MLTILDETIQKSGADRELIGDFDEDGNRIVKAAYRAYAKSPGADLRAAAAELDALVTKQNRR